MSESNSHGNIGYGMNASATGPGSTPSSSQAAPLPQQPYPYSTQPYQLPVAIPAQPVNTSNLYGPGGKKKKNSLLVIGIIILAVALIALGVAMLFVFKPFGLFEDPLAVDPPSMEQVNEVFAKADVKNNVLSRFQYVDLDNMDSPIFANTQIGNLAQNETGNKDVYCDATTDVTYQNDSIVAKTQLTTRLTYNKSDNGWVDGGVRAGDVTAQPMSGPDMEAILDNIPSLLKSYDSSLGMQFANSEVTTDANIGKNGGTATFVLTGPAPEGTDQPLTCNINTEIDWSDSRGWVIEVKSVDGLPEETEDPAEEEQPPAEEQPAEETPAPETPATTPPASSSASTNSGSTGTTNSGTSTGQPTMLLRCWSGDLVQVPGVIQFEGSHILLRTDHVIRVEFDNRVYITTYFELTGNAQLTNGQHVTVIGEISASGTLDKAPLVINLNYD